MICSWAENFRKVRRSVLRHFKLSQRKWEGDIMRINGLIIMICVVTDSRRQVTTRNIFGVRVPFRVKEAYALDEKNGNTK